MEALEQVPSWVYWPAAVAGALTAFTVIWRLGVVKIGRAFWAAVLAAPKIAEGIQDLGELIRGDVLARLEAGAQRFGRIEDTLETHRVTSEGHEGRLLILEGGQLAQKAHGEVQDARLNAHELALAELRVLSHQHHDAS